MSKKHTHSHTSSEVPKTSEEQNRLLMFKRVAKESVQDCFFFFLVTDYPIASSDSKLIHCQGLFRKTKGDFSNPPKPSCCCKMVDASTTLSRGGREGKKVLPGPIPILFSYAASISGKRSRLYPGVTMSKVNDQN